MTLSKMVRKFIGKLGAKSDLTPDAFTLRLERSLQRDGWRAPPQAVFKMRSKPLASAAR